MLSLLTAKWRPLWVKDMDEALLCNCMVDAKVVVLSVDAITTFNLFISIVVTCFGVGREAIYIVNWELLGIVIPITWNPILTLETELVNVIEFVRYIKFPYIAISLKLSNPSGN